MVSRWAAAYSSGAERNSVRGSFSARSLAGSVSSARGSSPSSAAMNRQSSTPNTSADSGRLLQAGAVSARPSSAIRRMAARRSIGVGMGM